MVTEQQCLDALRALQDAKPGRRITRRLFRQEAPIAETEWLKLWPTFTDYRKAAGLLDSVETQQVATQTGDVRDWLTEINATKANYAGQYLRTDNKRFKSVLIGSDFHDLKCDPFVARMFVEAAKRLQPDAIVFAGDWLDLPEMGRWGNSSLETVTIVDRFDWLHARLEELRDAAPGAELHYVEGNHEFRFLQALASASDALKTVLAEIHGFDLAGLFGLREYEVNYHSSANLLTFGKGEIANEVKNSFLVLWDSILIHHYPEGFNLGVPGCNGHNHCHLVKQHYSLAYGASEWHQLGCGHVRSAKFCNAEKWSNGFLIAHCDTVTKHTVFEYVEVKDFAVIGGQFYFRST